MTIARVVLSVIFVLTASAAYAGDPSPAPAPMPSPSGTPAVDAIRAACAEDIKQLCADVSPGGGRVVRCLRDNEDKLSPQCKDARAAARGVIERKSIPR